MGLLATFAQYTTDYNYSYSTGTTSGSTMSAGATAVFVVFYLAIIVFMLITLWKIYVKAGRPGWAAIVPVYNSWVLFEIVGYPGWWAILSFVPLVNIFPAIMMLISYYKLAKLFGKSDGFAVCNIFFGIITMPMLAFGSAQFQGNAPAASVPQVPVAPQTPYAPQAPVAPQPPVAPQAPAEVVAPVQPQAPTDTTPTPPQPPVVQ